MFLLIAGMTCGLCTLAAAVVLQFRLPGWLVLSGLASMTEERRTGIAIHPLRRGLSVLLYAVSVAFFVAGALLYARILSPTLFVRLLVPVLFLGSNLVMVLFRIHDSNSRSPPARKAFFLFLVLVNAVFICFYSLLLP